MSKTPQNINVLSIDFDYFQVTTTDIIKTCYPDGIDLPTYISECIWAIHYKDYYDKLMTVDINHEKLEELTQIILQQDCSSSCLIAQSHLDIYSFIKSHMNTYDNCNIYNIDMHHDMFNDNKFIDCGNWLGHIKNEYMDSQIVWIANEISEKLYGLKNIPVKYDFSCIKNKKFDLIFLCRSDNWFPPHLDKYFVKLALIMKGHFQNIDIHDNVIIPRNIEKYSDTFN